MIIVVIIFGLILGSFVNALVWRLYKQSSVKKAAKAKYSILNGRSMCPRCGHVLSPIDLIPVVSWLLLKGRCRYCHKPISIEYPLVEVVSALLFALSYIYWPLNFNNQGIFYFIVWLILLTGIIALAVYDLHWLTLPNKIIYPLFVLAVVQILATLVFYKGGFHYLLGSVLGLLIGGGVFYILFQVSRGKWIGGGDVKLGGLLGIYLGSAELAVLMIFFASLIGSLYSGPLLAMGKVDRKTVIPYGPFLIIATILLRLFGSNITSWLSSRGLVF